MLAYPLNASFRVKRQKSYHSSVVEQGTVNAPTCVRSTVVTMCIPSGTSLAAISTRML